MEQKETSIPKIPIGISFGATYCCISVWKNEGIEIISNEKGTNFPLFVSFTETDILIGEAARNQLISNPTNTIFDFKTLIGRKYNDPFIQENFKVWPFKLDSDTRGTVLIHVTYRGQTKIFTPADIFTIFLSKLKKIAEKYLRETISEVVITVPAYFNDWQRQTTKDSANLAGFNVKRLVMEPVASCIAYNLSEIHSKEENYVLVFDLGGKSLDVSLLVIEDGVFEVRTTTEDTHLGGNDFDNRLVDYFVQEFKRKHKKDLATNRSSILRLQEACENVKIKLSSQTEATIEIKSLFEGMDFTAKVTRTLFEELCFNLFRYSLSFIENCLILAKMEARNIDEVVLVGGSLHIPKLKALLSNFFNGKQIKCSINPEVVIAHGAATHTAILLGLKEKK